MGRISADIPDELEKKLRFKTIERFGGKKGDLSRAVEEAVRTWIIKRISRREIESKFAL
ncbi:MAG: 6 protein [Thermoproteota archaeon]|nr:6 protein [Thermoproteota archaeon]